MTRRYWDTTGAHWPANTPCEHCDGEKSPRVRVDRLRGHVCEVCDAALDEMLQPSRGQKP